MINASPPLLSSRRPARSPRMCLIAIVAAFMVAGCSSSSPGPTGPVVVAPIATPSPTGGSSPTGNAPPVWGDTLRIANQDGRATSMSNQSFGLPLGAASLVLSALYRPTASLDAIPDLTDGPCLPQGDGTVIRCKLIETTFHDGSPLTADDVAYAYRLRAQADCPQGEASCLGPTNPNSTYRDVRVVDDRTVDFVLSRRDPTFLTTILPDIAIEPRHVIEAAFARFQADATGLDPKALTSLADAIDTEASRDPPQCTTHIEDLKKLLDRLHVHWFPEDYGPDQAFDVCGFSGFGGQVARQAAAALQASGLDAVAAAYPLLSFNWQPVGTGPYRFVSQTAQATLLEASPTYHGGPAATRSIRLIPTGGDGSEIVAGQVDIAPDLFVNGVAASHPDAGLLPIQTTLPQFVALHYNLRPGHLFADRNLRLAMQLCVDLTRVVDAAWNGGASPIESPFMPGSWAYDADLPVPARDVAHAQSLLEASGWRRGPDGVYARAGQRLTAQIIVRGDIAARAKVADLIAAQARDCGMDITSRPVRFGGDIERMIGQYPHLIPGTKQPFDLYLGGWNIDPDPGPGTSLFDSRLVTTAVLPDGNGRNMIGFDDPAAERLIDEGLATYDQAERARAYRALQQELADQQPVLFLWSRRQEGAIRSAVASIGSPLDLTAPGWYWQPEDLVVRPDGP